jgi:multiple sugar transport system substrate-binding protein
MLLFEADAIRLAAAGQIDPLDEHIAGSSISTDDFVPAVQNLAEKMGGTYGLPWCYASQVLYYNKDLFDAAGVSYPTNDWTWDDYREAALKLSSGSGTSKIWGTDAFSFPGIWYSLAGQAGDPVINADGNLDLGDGIKRALEFTNELTNIDKVASPPAASGQNVTDLFAAGRSAMSLNGSWAIGTYRDAEFNWDIAPMPKDKTSYVSLHTGFYTIYKDSKQKDAAWSFIEFMMSEEGQKITSEVTSNPSAIKSLADSPVWQIGGKGGPTNWGAITDAAASSGAFGYTLADPTTSNDLGTDFNSYLLGAKSLDDVMKNVAAAANQ